MFSQFVRDIAARMSFVCFIHFSIKKGQKTLSVYQNILWDMKMKIVKAHLIENENFYFTHEMFGNKSVMMLI